MTTSRRGRWTGVATGFLLGGLYMLPWSLPATENDDDASGFGVLVFVLVFSVSSVLFVGARYVAGRDRSFRSGAQTAVWGTTVGMLLTFTLWMVATIQRHPQVMAADLSLNAFWTLIWIPVWGLPFGILGAASGSGKPRPVPR